MTRRDYQMVADAIREKLADFAPVTDVERNCILAIVDALADGFKRDNGRFDRERFKEACGV